VRVLLVTDQFSESAYLHKALRECTHSVHAIRDLADGFHVASEEHFDVVVALCADPAGYGVLLRLLPTLAKLQPVPVAVAVVSAASAIERTCLLRAGADACLVQPYAFAELHERMQAIVRLRSRVEVLPSQMATLGSGSASLASAAGPASAAGAWQGRVANTGVSAAVAEGSNLLRLDDETHRLAEGSRVVTLSVGEYLFVKRLMRGLHRPVSREQLISYAWPDREDVEPATVGLVASRVRRKMQEARFDAFIETVPRFGYRLCSGDVNAVQQER